MGSSKGTRDVLFRADAAGYYATSGQTHDSSFYEQGRGIDENDLTGFVIAYGELMHQAKTISTIAFNPIEMYTAVALMFFAMIFPVAMLVQRFEKNMAAKG